MNRAIEARLERIESAVRRIRRAVRSSRTQGYAVLQAQIVLSRVTEDLGRVADGVEGKPLVGRLVPAADDD